jgi:hypothetical protein
LQIQTSEVRTNQLHGPVEAVPAHVHQADPAAAEREEERQTMPHGAGTDDRYLIEAFHHFTLPFLARTFHQNFSAPKF